MEMNNKEWIRPHGFIEAFEANEYISACGKTGWNFHCDAGNKNKKYDVIVDNGDGILGNGDRNLTAGEFRYFHPCGIYHSSEQEGDHKLYDGWIVDNGGNDYRGYYDSHDRYHDYNITKVKIWTDGDTNVHCTTNLKGWTTDKS